MINIVDLPDIVLVHIFSFLSYDCIAQNRIVCKCFNDVGGRMLNKGFLAAEKFNNKCLREIKAKLPRRESERRSHPLTKQCEIFASIETRINMLAMTFSKWINHNVCCFIPGKVLDEIFRVLRNLPIVFSGPCSRPKALEMLQELRDLSSMAMEHFDEKILPQLKRNYYRSRSSAVADALECTGARDENRLLRCSPDMLFMMACRLNGLTMLRPLPESETREPSPPPPSQPNISQSEYKRLIVLNSLMRKKLQAQSVMIANQGREVSELRKQVEEWETKVRELSENIQRANNMPLTPQHLLKSPDLLLSSKRSRPTNLCEEPSPSSSKVPRMDLFLDN